VRVTDRVIPEYRPFIEASPFVALATGGPEGLDCSPRGVGSDVTGERPGPR
jgi:predicted pyridoxine 5'-phosphate oxidase superfamily flavin-nucleotide-binding protein